MNQSSQFGHGYVMTVSFLSNSSNNNNNNNNNNNMILQAKKNDGGPYQALLYIVKSPFIEIIIITELLRVLYRYQV
jgi:hypothetical protein